MYLPSNRALKYMKQNLTELKEEIDNSIIIVDDFNISFSIMIRTNRQQINKDTEDLNKTMYQINLTTIEHSIQQWQNICFPQVYTEHFLDIYRPNARP